MSEPITRDPDMVKMPRDMHDFMMETTKTLARIEQKFESHVLDDKAALARIDERLNTQGGVVSSITEDRSEITGGWNVMKWIGGSIIALAALAIAYFKGGK